MLFVIMHLLFLRQPEKRGNGANIGKMEQSKETRIRKKKKEARV